MSPRTTGDTGNYRAFGTGPTTADGSSVEVYRRLPYRGEVDPLIPWMPEKCAVLELGCGTGRMTRALLAKGHRVTAVDNSADMLAEVPNDATKVLSNIEDLDLGQRFDVVILASCLVNTPDTEMRMELLKCGRRHLGPGGTLLLERFDPEWLEKIAVGPIGNVGPIDMCALEVAHRGKEVDLCFEYRDGAEAWLQYFTARVLDDAAISLDLESAGFAPPAWINRRWAAALTGRAVD